MNIDNEFKKSFHEYFKKNYKYKKYECNLNNDDQWIYIQAGSGFGDNFHYELINDSIQLHIEFKDKNENIFFANALIKILKKDDYKEIIPNGNYIWFLLKEIDTTKENTIKKEFDRIIEKIDPIINQLFLFDFKRNKHEKKEKSINCRFISVCGIISEIIFVIPLVLTMVLKFGFELKYFLVLLVIFTFACIITLHIVLYKILLKKEKLKFLNKVIFQQEIENDESLTTKVTKNDNQPTSSVTETKDSITYDSKSKVLISAIEAIREL